MQSLPLLIFDLDSVLNNLHEEWIKLVERRTGDRIRYDECTAWTYPLGQKKYLNLLVSEPGFFYGLGQASNAVSVVTRLHQEGFPIAVCSSAHPKTTEDKQGWLLERFPWMKPDDIIFATRKYLLARRDRILIDDAWHNISAFAAHGGSTILVDHPWNRYDDDGEPIRTVRAGDMIDVYAQIAKITEDMGCRMEGSVCRSR